MNTETLVSSPIGKMFARILATAMESRFRYRFFGPAKILKGVDDLQGQAVLEVGCGTGFFTIPATRFIDEQGSLLSIDIVPESVEMVSKKVQAAHLQNVRVLKADALNTKLDTASFHTVLLFGVIPAPMVPLNPLLAELHRILRQDGNLAVWPHVPGWLPQSILRSDLFTLSSKRNGVYNFKRS
jgi:ubiquinone/menaquinone biosynthesis C-methylase UbiE